MGRYKDYLIEQMDKEPDHSEYYEHELKSLQSRLSRIQIFLFSISVSLLIAIFTLVLSYATGADSEKWVKKSSIKMKLLTAVESEAPIDVLENIYLNRIAEKRTLRNIFSSFEEYYEYDTEFTKILIDLKSDLYTDSVAIFTKGKISNLRDSTAKHISNTIIEINQVNPFEKLFTPQKDLFENLRNKLLTSYAPIENDVNKIVDELYQQNTLVNEYLSDSKTSFWISIIAVLIALFTSGYQIYQNSSSRLAQVLLEIVKKQERIDNSGDDAQEEQTTT